MKKLFVAVALIASASWSIANADLTGDFAYENGDEHDSIALEVTIRPASGEGKLSFGLGAGHPDGHGAAPDGGGNGEIDAEGVFRFAYEDSFYNKGRGTFRRTKKGYLLSIQIEDVQDPRCLVFYGEHTLQRRPPKK